MSAITLTDSEVIIQGSYFVKHDGYMHRVGPLLRTLHNLRDEINSKKLRLIFPDGEPFEMVGFDVLVKNIVQKLNLLPDRVILEMIDHYPIYCCDWATVQLRPSWFFKLAQQLVKIDQCNLLDHAPMFGGVYGRLSHSRMLMAYMLETEFPEDSFVIFQPDQESVDFEFEPVSDQFFSVLSWYQDRQENQRNLLGRGNGFVSATECLPVYHDMFGNYQIEIVIETNTKNQGWFTEKTTKCLVSGKPFIMYNTPMQLSRLRDMGFRTFSGLVDESYDTIMDDEARFDAIQEEIRRLANLDQPQRQNILQRMNEVSQYNKDNYDRIVQEYYQCFM